MSARGKRARQTVIGWLFDDVVEGKDDEAMGSRGRLGAQ